MLVCCQDPYREASPLRTHLGAALLYSPLTDSLFLTIGDFHLAASSLSQAQAIGLANTEKDYALLADPAAAIGAVIEIPLDGEEPYDRSSWPDDPNQLLPPCG